MAVWSVKNGVVAVFTMYTMWTSMYTIVSQSAISQCQHGSQRHGQEIRIGFPHSHLSLSMYSVIQHRTKLTFTDAP